MRVDEPSELFAAYSICVADEVLPRWVMRNSVGQSFQHFEAWRSHAVQFDRLVVDSDSGEPIAHAVCFEVDLRNRHTSAGIAAIGGRRHRLLAVAGFAAFLHSVFDMFDLRKVYLEVMDLNLTQFATLSQVFREEGTLHEHDFVAGAYRDLHMFSIDRAGLDAAATALLR